MTYSHMVDHRNQFLFRMRLVLRPLPNQANPQQLLEMPKLAVSPPSNDNKCSLSLAALSGLVEQCWYQLGAALEQNFATTWKEQFCILVKQQIACCSYHENSTLPVASTI